MPDFSNLLSIEPKYPNLTVIVPAYNEDQEIASVILKLKEYAKTIILVDDGSQDDTEKIARYVNTDYIIKNTNSVGLRNSILIGVKKAKEIQGDYILISSHFEFTYFKFISDVMEHLIKNPDLDICLGIYKNVYDHYKKTSSYDINSNKDILKNDSNIVFFIIKKSAVTDSFDITNRYTKHDSNWMENQKFSLLRLNVEKDFRRSPEILKRSILFFVFSAIFYLIIVILLNMLIPSLFYTALPYGTIIFFAILMVMTFLKYTGDLNEHLY